GSGRARDRTRPGPRERRHEQRDGGRDAFRPARRHGAHRGGVPQAEGGVMRRLLALVLVAGAATVARADEAPLPEVAAALARVQDRSTIELTTTGRKSGNEHTKPIWFVVSDGKIVVQAGKDGKTDWYQNLLKTPTEVAKQDGYLFRVRALPVNDT